jgi:hypothetical protein
MANLTTFVLAEARLRAKLLDKTWVTGYVTMSAGGQLWACRVIRPMTTAFTQGGWVELTDNTTD